MKFKYESLKKTLTPGPAGCPQDWLAQAYVPDCVALPSNNKKKVAVITTVQREFFFTPYWQSYYGDLFGLENLYVLCDTVNDYYLSLFDKKVNLINMQQEYHGDNAWMIENIQKWQHLLLDIYETVIFADSDEFLIPAPLHWKDLSEFLDKNTDDYFRAQGFNIIHNFNEEPVINPTRPILSQRKYWYKHGGVNGGGESKQLIIRKQGVRYSAGLHWCEPSVPEHPELFLIHLKEFDYNINMARWQSRLRTPLPKHHTMTDNSFGNVDNLSKIFNEQAVELIPDVFRKLDIL
jgi:hypothetical protein